MNHIQCDRFRPAWISASAQGVQEGFVVAAEFEVL
jgi:hypothetical protein